MPGKSLIAQNLNRIKEKYGLTIAEWSKKSGVPESTIARYLSSSLNIPNFPYVCAMLKCLGEPIEEFYDKIDAKTDTPTEALKLDAVPPSVVGDLPIDVPESKAAIQERVIVQAEAMQAQQATVREHAATIALLEAKLEMTERIVEEKERTIASLEDLGRRRLQALQALCASY